MSRFAEKVAPLGKRLYLWEINAAQREAVIFLQQKGYDIEAFISFNVYPDLRKAWGVNVFHPEFLNRPYKEDFILCISRYEYRLHKHYLLDYLRLSRRQIYVDYRIHSDVRDRLIGAGIWMRGRIVSAHNRVRGRIGHLRWQVGFIRNLLSGYMVYRKLRREYPQDVPLLFFNYPGSGDAYLSGSLIEPYLRDQNISEFAAVATGRVSRIILDGFGYRNIAALTDRESNLLRQFMYFVGADRLNIRPLIQVANHLDICIRLAATRLSLLDMYVYKIFGYDSCPAVSFPRFSSDPGRIKVLFEDKHLRKGKTVVISPYANSEVCFSPLFWANIVSLLKRMGFDIATMCHEPEVPLKFTTALDFPLPYAADVLEYAGYFIGVRSGFCDLTIPAKCRKVILYPENIYGQNHPFYRIPLSHINYRPIYEWASFNAMGIDAGAVEVRCTYRYTKQLEQIIAKAMGGENEGLHNS